MIFCYCLVYCYKGFEYECGEWSISLLSEVVMLCINVEFVVVILR